MCVEKIQKHLLAMALGIVLMLMATGSTKSAFILHVGIMIILMVSGFTGHCFITKVLNDAFPMCKEEEGKD